jgi:hypothetical protein
MMPKRITVPKTCKDHGFSVRCADLMAVVGLLAILMEALPGIPGNLVQVRTSKDQTHAVDRLCLSQLNLIPAVASLRRPMWAHFWDFKKQSFPMHWNV